MKYLQFIIKRFTKYEIRNDFGVWTVYWVVGVEPEQTMGSLWNIVLNNTEHNPYFGFPSWWSLYNWE